MISFDTIIFSSKQKFIMRFYDKICVFLMNTAISKSLTLFFVNLNATQGMSLVGREIHEKILNKFPRKRLKQPPEVFCKKRCS